MTLADPWVLSLPPIHVSSSARKMTGVTCWAVAEPMNGWVILHYIFIYMCTYVCVSVCVCGCLGCFHILAVINNAVMNVGVHISFWISVFIFFGWIPRSGINEWYGFLGSTVIRNLPANAGRSCKFDPWFGNTPWRRKQHSTPVRLSGKFHGQRSLVGYSTWGRKELDMTEHTP